MRPPEPPSSLHSSILSSLPSTLMSYAGLHNSRRQPILLRRNSSTILWPFLRVMGNFGLFVPWRVVRPSTLSWFHEGSGGSSITGRRGSMGQCGASSRPSEMSLSVRTPTGCTTAGSHRRSGCDVTPHVGRSADSFERRWQLVNSRKWWSPRHVLIPRDSLFHSLQSRVWGRATEHRQSHSGSHYADPHGGPPPSEAGFLDALRSISRHRTNSPTAADLC